MRRFVYGTQNNVEGKLKDFSVFGPFAKIYGGSKHKYQ